MKTSALPTPEGCFKSLVVVPVVAALLLLGNRSKSRKARR